MRVILVFVIGLVVGWHTPEPVRARVETATVRVAAATVHLAGDALRWLGSRLSGAGQGA